jgi:hypothetical protein
MGEKWPTHFAVIWLVPYQMKGSLTCHKSATWDRRLYFPSEILAPETSMLTTRLPKPLLERLLVCRMVSLVVGLPPRCL